MRSRIVKTIRISVISCIAVFSHVQRDCVQLPVQMLTPSSSQKIHPLPRKSGSCDYTVSCTGSQTGNFSRVYAIVQTSVSSTHTRYNRVIESSNRISLVRYRVMDSHYVHR